MRRRPHRTGEAGTGSGDACGSDCGNEWLDTPALCQELAISRSTLGRWRGRGLLIPGHHWVRKSPAAPHSDLLWHRSRCSALLTLARVRCPRTMAEFQPLPAPQGAAEYVLLHLDTGTARYATTATAAEIHRANQRLQGAGSDSRYVEARHLGHHVPHHQA